MKHFSATSLETTVGDGCESWAASKLVSAVAFDRNPEARDTILQRNLIPLPGRGLVSFPLYVSHLRESLVVNQTVDEEVASQATHMLVERFTCLDVNGVDCSAQYRAILSLWESRRKKNPDCGEIVEEDWIGDVFKACVDRHLRYCVKEAIRQNDSSTRRYEWREEGESFWIKIPSDLSASKFRRWLKEQWPDGIPQSEEERSQVQEAVWKNFPRPRIRQLSDSDWRVDPIRDLWDHIDGLANRLMRVVVTEKMDRFDQLPLRLKNIGRENLRLLIERIFHVLQIDAFNARSIADEFGIPLSTFSEIAGPCWWKKINEESFARVPDLWSNVIDVLAANEDFRDAILQSGIEREVEFLSARRKADD